MSRRSKRVRQVLPAYVIPNFEESNSENESDNDNFNLLHAALKHYTKRAHKRNPFKKTPAKRTPAKNTVSEVINLDSDFRENDLSQAMKDNHQKNIQTKVDSFFKSSHLLSDDDDEPPATKSQSVGKSTVSKEIYVLTDSDDEIPSTSVTKTTTSYSWSTTNLEVCKPTKVDKEEDIMEFVDKILESNDGEINPEQDSWTEFKSKTEEILGSVKEILGSVEDNAQNKKVDLVAENPDKDKRTCPICFEVLGGNNVPGATVCGHIFCMGCIKQVAKISKSCPTCRKRITMKQIHPLYL